MIDCEFEHDTQGRLDQIETDWTLIFQPAHLVMRYADAVKNYLRAFLHSEHDAEEVAQEFFLWVTQNGLARARRDRGRFRDYLKKVVRNKALNFLRRKRRHTTEIDLLEVPTPEAIGGFPDQEWLVQWRRCLLRRAWQRLEDFQHRSPKGRYFTVLHLCTKYPGEDSRQLAARVQAIDGSTLSAAAFRKQVSRARRVFSELLVDEVSTTLDQPSPANVEEELIELGLLTYVQDYLSIGRRASTI